MIQSTAEHLAPERLQVMVVVFILLMIAIVVRLSYWQIIRGPVLRAEAKSQYEKLIITQGKRGSIKTADGYTVVMTEQRYRLFAQPHLLTTTPSEVARQLAPLVLDLAPVSASVSAATQLRQIEDTLVVKLSRQGAKWVMLLDGLDEVHRSAVKHLEITGVGTEPYFARAYPEASLAAQVVGFVGKNEGGDDVGYFGIEGALDRELSGAFDRRILPRVLPGLKLPSSLLASRPQDGRDITLTIRRDLQHIAEENLAYGLEQYGAKSGEIIIMQPQTGHILAMATAPGYDPAAFADFDAQLYKNPAVSSGYEPGSTLKTLTVAAGIDAGVITPETQCPQCDGPRKIAGFTLKTWNNEYHPNITMTEAIAKSDNTAMIFVAEQLGSEKLKSYLQKFGLGHEAGVELQEDTSPPFPAQWGPVELATISFGQGISTTSLQVLKAINAIANQGKVVRPTLIKTAEDFNTGEILMSEPVIESEPVSAQTAQKVTEMMVYAAQKGEAQWIASNDHWVAAKTGTSQVPIPGGYATDRTIATFIGFAPPDHPEFIMLVKLVEPTSSPWAAETAAPLWYRVAKKVFLVMNIPPDKSILN